MKRPDPRTALASSNPLVRIAKNIYLNWMLRWVEADLAAMEKEHDYHLKSLREMPDAISHLEATRDNYAVAIVINNAACFRSSRKSMGAAQ